MCGMALLQDLILMHVPPSSGGQWSRTAMDEAMAGTEDLKGRFHVLSDDGILSCVLCALLCTPLCTSILCTPTYLYAFMYSHVLSWSPMHLVCSALPCTFHSRVLVGSISHLLPCTIASAWGTRVGLPGTHVGLPGTRAHQCAGHERWVLRAGL